MLPNPVTEIKWNNDLSENELQVMSSDLVINGSVHNLIITTVNKKRSKMTNLTIPVWVVSNK